MESDAQRYRNLAEDALHTFWALYAVAFVVLFVTAGVAFPIVLVLSGIAQMIFWPKYEKYKALAKHHESQQQRYSATPLLEGK